MSDTTMENGSDGWLQRINANRWLIWKETRQLAPLVVALSAVAFALVICHTFASQYFKWLINKTELPLLVIPGLFATGAGAMVVGQEREQGTMRWLASLPISARKLVLVKFAIASIGLLVMWAFAAILITLFGLSEGTASRWEVMGMTQAANEWLPINYPTWFVHSFMVLMAGFLCSWKIKNQFHALIALIALASVPLMIGELQSVIFGVRGTFLSASSEATTWLIASFVLIFVYGGCAYSFALKALLPQRAPRISNRKEKAQSLEAYQPTSVIGQAPEFGTQIAPIAWQSVRSARLTLAILLGLLVIGVFQSALWLPSTRNPGFWATASVLFAPFAVSWLGVFAFKNDGGSKRIRFLADRGVSCGTVFWGRHLVPISILAVGLIIYAGLGLISTQSSDSEILLSVLGAALIAAMIYFISQWISQVVRMVIVATILAPVCSLVLVGWLLYCVVELGTPPWVSVLFVLLPLLASRLMMSRYMDQRDRPISFVVAGVLLLLMFSAPLVGPVYRFASTEGIPRQLRAELIKEANKTANAPAEIPANIINGYSQRWHEKRKDLIGLEDFDAELGDEALYVHKDLPDQVIEVLPEHYIESELNALDGNRAITVYGYAGQYLSILMHQRLAFRAALAEKAEDPLKTFRPWLIAMGKMVRGLRKSNVWSDQEAADRIEIWLIDALKSKELAAFRDEDFYGEVVVNLSTSQQRKVDRRRAVLASWIKRQKLRQLDDEDATARRASYEMGGLTFGKCHINNAAFLAELLVDRYLDRIVVTALEAAKSPSSDKTWLSKMHRELLTESIPQADGPYGERFRSLPAVICTRFAYIQYPARFWGMPWEQAIDELKASIGATGDTIEENKTTVSLDDKINTSRNDSGNDDSAEDSKND